MSEMMGEQRLNSNNAKELFDLLFSKELDIERLKTELNSGKYSADDINIAASVYVENCMFEVKESMDYDVKRTEGFGEIVPGFASSHLLDAISVLADYGLNPDMYTNPEDVNQIS